MPPYDPSPKKENTLGLIGFIVSLVGLILCGIPSLIGLILSAIGLKKEPRGLAIAGVIIGLLGLVLLAVTSVTVYRSYISVTQGFTLIFAEAQLEQAAVEIGLAWEEKERIPTQEEGDEMLSGRNDMMNNSLVYQTDGTSFSIRSAGADGILETEDDIVVGPFEDPQTAIDLEQNLADFGTDFEDLESDSEEDLNTEVDDTPDEPKTKTDDLMKN